MVVIGLAGIDRASYCSELAFSADAGELEILVSEQMASAVLIALKAAFSNSGVTWEECACWLGAARVEAALREKQLPTAVMVEDDSGAGMTTTE